MNNRMRAGGFTLVELLVVIGIIALLAALLLPAINAAIKQAHLRQARLECAGLKTAVQSFANDYGKAPVPPAEQGKPDRPLDGPESQAIVRVLIGADRNANPKGVNYMEGQGAGDDGAFIDPWDTQYRFILDSDYDGKVDYLGKSYRMAAVVVSAGPDQRFGTGDDVTTLP